MNAVGEAPKVVTRAYVSLSASDVAILKKLKVGSRVRVVLYGEVKSVQQSTSDETKGTADQGSFDMDVSRVNTVANNEVADLLDDDEV